MIKRDSLDLGYFTCKLELRILQRMMQFPTSRKFFERRNIHNLNSGPRRKLFFVRSSRLSHRLVLNTVQVPSRRKKSFSHSAENALPASAHTVPAYPARPRARAARRDHGMPFRKVSHRFRRQFHRSWYLHARLDTCWSFSLNLKSSLHPGAVEYANRSLRLRFLPSQELRPLRERYASWRRRKGWSDASLRGAQRLCRWVRCNHRRELLL